MRGLKLGVGLLALLAIGVPAQAETTVLKNVTVIDGTSATAQPNSAIVMTDGKIAWVGPVSGLEGTCRSHRQGSFRKVRDAWHHR